MHVLILIGKRKATGGGFSFECLYVGQDGVELAAAAEKAAAAGGYVELGRLTNPITAPMAIDPTPIRQTTPVFPRNAKREVQLPVRPLSRLEQQSRKPVIVALDNDGKLKVPESQPRRDAAGLIIDGPTFEKWLIRGYAPTGYPPNGYAEKDSPGWTMFKEAQKAAAAAATVPASTAPVASTAPATADTVPTALAPAGAAEPLQAVAPVSTEPAPAAVETSQPALVAPVAPEAPVALETVPAPAAAQSVGAETKTVPPPAPAGKGRAAKNK